MPRVSVILPAYYSHATLRDCLEGLRRQAYRDFEVILVNSSQEEITGSIAAKFPEVRFVQSPSRLLPHAARNRGAEHAAGDLLVFSDPDCIARPDWLTHLVAAWTAGHAVVGGAMGLASDAWVERGIHACKFHPLLENLPAGTRWILPTANAAYARRVWNQIGPFEGDVFAGDAILSWKAAAAGFEPWFEPRAVVEHRHANDVRPFARERLRRGAEFGQERAAYERWSKARLAASIVATPLLISWVLIRAARDTAQGGWFRSYVSTFPLQITGHAMWALGETKGYWKALRNPARDAKPRRAGYPASGELPR